MIKTISIEQLEYLANDFLLENFNLELSVPVKISGRLTATAGYFQWKIKKSTKERIPVNITLSKNLILYYDNKDIIETLYHECVHYALFVLGEPYKDGDHHFESTLTRLGVPRTGTLEHRGKVHLYECEECHKQIQELRRFNTERYSCICNGKFRYVKEFIYKG